MILPYYMTCHYNLRCHCNMFSITIVYCDSCILIDVQILFSCRERNTELMREAIHGRYMLLPYFYTLFREANTSGVPILRPLWMEFPSDEATFSKDESFMVGNSLLVQGIFTEVLSY